MKQHKHCELIKAWADGAEIEVKNLYGDWVVDKTPNWTWNDYRIKTESKTEPEKQWMYIYNNAQEAKTWISPIEPDYYMNVATWTYMGKFEVLK